MRVLILVVATMQAASAQAAPRARLSDVVEQVDRVSIRARRAGGACRQSVSEKLMDLGDRLDAQRAGRPRLGRTLDELSDLHAEADFHGCPDEVLDGLLAAMDLVSDARAVQLDDRRPEDERAVAWLARLQVTVGDQQVKVKLPELTLRGLKGQAFHLGARFRSANGPWSQLDRTPRWSVPADPFVWKDASVHVFARPALAAADVAGGRFIARVSVFDDQEQELGYREVRFRLGGPPVAAGRDCGTGADLGCSQARGGVFPIEREGFMAALASFSRERNEQRRVKVAEGALATAFLTAAQLALVLEQFSNDKLRLDVARLFLGRVVNPADATVLASRFTSPDARARFAELVQAQIDPDARPRAWRVQGEMDFRAFSFEAATRDELGAKCRKWKEDDIRTQGFIMRLAITGGRTRRDLLNTEGACAAVVEGATPLF